MGCCLVHIFWTKCCVDYLIPKNTTMLNINAKMLIRCMRHTILEFIMGLLGKRPSHFFW